MTFSSDEATVLTGSLRDVDCGNLPATPVRVTFQREKFAPAGLNASARICTFRGGGVLAKAVVLQCAPHRQSTNVWPSRQKFPSRKITTGKLSFVVEPRHVQRFLPIFIAKSAAMIHHAA
jgi:hypothetical protein